MKKIFLLVLLTIAFSSCDDGELKLESFNFEDVNIQKCSDINSYLIFKTKNEELLLVSLPKTTYEQAFFPEATPPGSPRTYTIENDRKVVYRKYSGTVSNGTICDVIPPSSPVVSKEWIATGGTISVITTEILNTSNVVTGYSHNITFKNVNFASIDNSFSFESYIYGNYVINL